MDDFDQIMTALAKGPRATESDITHLVDWALEARDQLVVLEAKLETMVKELNKVQLSYHLALKLGNFEDKEVKS